METFFWHDYETWGKDPTVSAPAQFAGVRTDMDLNVIGDPIVLFCKPSRDFFPSPEACLITGVTPQVAEQRGVIEYKFAAAIHAELAKPETCSVGFNTLRFDDEFTRHLFYRNFYDPYQREYQHGNTRWDIIDLVRACYALRPEGIQWPVNAEGRISFKLEHFAAANHIAHDAHEALSDVWATIALAKLIKEKQPKLFDYYFKLRKKAFAASFLNVDLKRPVLHISNMFSVERYCAALVMPLAKNPNNPNEVICYDLSVDPTPFIELSADEVRERVFTPSEVLQDKERIPLKGIHLNRSPFVCSLQALNDDVIATRLQMDKESCERNREKILSMPGLLEKIQAIYFRELKASDDPEKNLYQTFIPDVDRMTSVTIRGLTGKELANKKFNFLDKRLPELLFRYRARNFPETLTATEYEKWQEFCRARLADSVVYLNELVKLENLHVSNVRNSEILRQLRVYVEGICGVGIPELESVTPAEAVTS